MPIDQTCPPGSTELVERAFQVQPYSQFVRDVRKRHQRNQRLSQGQVEALRSVITGVRRSDTNRQSRIVEMGIDDWLATLRLTRKDVEQLAEMRKRENPEPGAGRFANIVPVGSVGIADSIEELRRRKRDRGGK
jgi:hypothetical protein